MAQTIAIIGSGMAGLAAAWYLGERHEVTLFERHPCLGIGAHSIELPGGRIDAPLRVLYPGYYPELFRVLAESGVAVEALDAALSFSELDGDSYFRYWNVSVCRRTLPVVSPRSLLAARPRQILRDLGRFVLQVPRAERQGGLRGHTLGSYLEQAGYSAAFIDKFLVPCFAGINTVSNADVRAYPAELIAQYFNLGLLFSKVFRPVGGAATVAAALARRAARVALGARIRSVQRLAAGVAIRMEDGAEQRFDAAIFATQANQVLPLLGDASDGERRLLAGFRYGGVHVVIHRDPALAPRHRKTWAPVNYLLSAAHDRPMITIWVNALLPTYASDEPVFQTVNPHVAAQAALVVQETRLERPIVDLHTEALIRDLDRLHAEPGRRIFFCGSYAARGIPLLESAAVSAQRIARRLAA